MTDIALVRHGQTDLNLQLRWQGTTDAPLNELGHRQARQTGNLLAGHRWSHIVTSPLQRARQTAAAVATRLELPEPQVDSGLIEQHGGVAEGMLESEIDLRWPIEESIPGSETRDQVAERGARALTALAKRYAGESFIVVAHGTLIRLTLGALTGVEQPLLDNGHFVVATFDADEPDPWTLTSAADWADGFSTIPRGDI